MKVTHEVFSAFLDCDYKGYQKSKSIIESKQDHQALEKSLLLKIKRDFLNRITSEFRKGNIPQKIKLTKLTMKTAFPYLIDVQCETEEYSSNLDVLIKVPGDSLLGNYLYEPVLLIPKYKVSNIDKLILTFQSLLIKDLQGEQPEFGKIVFGNPISTMTIKIGLYLKQTYKILKNIHELIAQNDPPEIILKKHCKVCGFKKNCYTKAKEADHLSLLTNINKREIFKLNSRGIFTVNQLSYTFRPRRRKKKSKTVTQKHYHSLKALAIRKNKIYILERPQLPKVSTKIYIDIEGDPDRNLVYLIGFVVDDGRSLKNYSLWMNDKSELKKTAKKALSIINQYNDKIIYHYGSYETRFFASLIKILSKVQLRSLNKIIDKSVNVLPLINKAIYFPTYSNGLKDIAEILDFHWTFENASGLHSIYWRREWEDSKDKQLKDRLLKYNYEDCLALRALVEFVYFVANNQSDTTHEFGKVDIEYDFDEETYRKYGDHEFGRVKFALDDYDLINKCSYFDYQRNKVFLRDNSLYKNNTYVSHKKAVFNLKINKESKIHRPKVCPRCKSRRMHNAFNSHQFSKIVVDLKFIEGGIKRWVTHYTAIREVCKDCGKTFFPKRYKAIRGKYGHNLLSWVVYQNIANQLSLGKIAKTISEEFQIPLKETGRSIISDIKIKSGILYKKTYQSLISKISTWNVIHCDETEVSIKGEKGYIWVFTNMCTVVFMFKETREAKFISKLIKGFEGVFISDFYRGYDSLECLKQKCLIHLIRDINRDLFKHQQDEQLKYTAKLFGVLLREIVETIDKYGLKKRHLNKHNRDVERFYSSIEKVDYDSQIAYDLFKRFEKYRNSLFTFLNHDGVTWNNNNAEHAFKHFATYRRNVNGTFTKKGIERYLTLLSIYETCKYRNISFLKFLLSEEKYIERYFRKYTAAGNRRKTNRKTQ